MTAPPAPPPQSDNRTGFWFVHEPNYKYLIAGVPIVVGVLLFLAFFITSWISVSTGSTARAAKSAIDDADAYVKQIAESSDRSEDDVREDLKERYDDAESDNEPSATAWKIWTGADRDSILRLDEDYDGETGFGAVEGRDRLLIIELLFSIGLIAVGVLYLMDRLDQRRTLIATAAIALVLFLFPLFWEGLKGAYVSGNVSDSYAEFSEDEDVAKDLANIDTAIIKSVFATFEFVFLAFIALLFSLGSYLILQSEHNRLGTNWPPPISPFPSSASSGTPPPPPPSPPPPTSDT